MATHDSHLGTIIETGLSQPSSTSTSPPKVLGLDSTKPVMMHDPNVHDDDDDDVFQYPASDDEGAEEQEDTGNNEHDSEEEEFRYPVSPESPVATGPFEPEPGPSSVIPPVPEPEVEQPKPIVHPTPVQLKALYDAGLSGDLVTLRQIVSNATASGEIEAFALVNDASPITGLTVVHACASRGHLDALKWLIHDCGGIPDLEDKEGETALHKAALNGHLAVIQYLVTEGSEVNAKDGDGWTALHNACSKGYLDIVRWLCESGGAIKEVAGVRGVDIRSKGGWTPLMNAASKGHLPVVLYLLSKQAANPLIRNNWGETAYDVAAAVFEIWICDVLQRAEADLWRISTVPYDPLKVHMIVPVILHENQRLDVRFKTLAVNSGRPKFSVSGLGRRGRRAPFELRLPRVDEDTGKRFAPAWQSDVQLPYIEDPFTLPKPITGKDRPVREGAEKSHFWLSDWALDLTYPRVNVNDGWQYAHSFEDTEDHWSADPPPQLERILSGSAAIAVSLGGTQIRQGSSSSSVSPYQWVRRRRWVRVMRRRLDIPPLPFLGPDGAMYQLSGEGTLVPFVSDVTSDDFIGEGQELGAMPTSFLSVSQDYVARSRYLAGTPHGSDTPVNGDRPSAAETRRAIAKLERAVMELRTGMLGDEDQERRTQAEVLLNAYSRELERKRLAAGAAGLFSLNDNEGEDVGDDESEESFHYPGSSPTASTSVRPSSIRSQGTDYFNRSSFTPRTSSDLTQHLSQAPEFRVPTHEAPQKVMIQRRNTPTPHSLHAQWERDDNVPECRGCKRRFTFYFRKHCRRCGRIFCDRCSSFRTSLDPSDVVRDPSLPEGNPIVSPQRVCEACYEESNANIPSRFHGVRTQSMERIVIDERRLAIPSHVRRSETSSQISDLADCPVCNRNLSEFGSPAAQEEHVKACLDGGVGSIQQPPKYLVYNLPGESLLIGTECVICLEEFVKGSTVARLSCLCSFHSVCLSAWLQRGRSCPVHARDN